MALIVVRALFVLVAGGLAASLVGPGQQGMTGEPIRLFGGIMFLAIGLIALDIFIPIKRIDTITAIYFGLLMGLLLTYVLGIALTPFVEQGETRRFMQLGLGMILCYSCISFLIQTKDDFFGNVVNKSARIAATAGAAEVRVSDEVRIQAVDHGFAFSSPALVPLKGFDGEQLTHLLVWNS